MGGNPPTDVTLAAGGKAPEPAGRFDDRYRVVKTLGAGGFGKVLLVEDELHQNERLALKVILPEHSAAPEFEQRFRNEIRILRAMRHPGIPQIFNDGRTKEGEFYFTMEFVEGATLEEITRKHAPLPPERIVRLTRQILAVLDYAHGHDVVHRDLKPSNIVVVQPGTDGEQVKILDFGIAKVLRKEGPLSNALTMQTAAPLGTPHYMSPEQVRGKDVDGRTDLYALGVIIYRMVSGEFPFAGETPMQVAAARLEDDPTPLRGRPVPTWLATLITKLLARDRESRPSVPEILERLDHLSAGQKTIERRQRRFAAAGGVVVLVAAVLVWNWWNWMRDRGEAVAPSRDPAVEHGVATTSPAIEAPAGDGSEIAVDDGAPKIDPIAPPPDGRRTSEVPTEVPTEESMKVPPIAPPPTIVKLSPDDGASLPANQATVEIEGEADLPLKRAEISGRAAAVDGTRFHGPVDLVEGRNEIVVKLVGVEDQAGETRRIVLTRSVVRVPAGFKAIAGASAAPSGWAASIVHERSGVELLLVERGSFARPGGASMTIPREFYVGRFEVSRNEFQAFCKIVGRPMPASTAPDPASDLPVVNVTWDEANLFCRWLDPGSDGASRLPTIDEWEYAAAGHQALAYPWGGEWRPRACNSSDPGDGRKEIAPVGSFQDDRSWCGAMDMGGNVTEWCTAPDGDQRALRGGSCTSSSENCRVFADHRFVPTSNASIGFRVVVEIRP